MPLSISIPTPVGTVPWLAAMIEVLERQSSLLDQLDDLARAQSALIAERRTDRLLDVLSQRQSLIDEFTVCQAEMTALSQDMDRRLAQADEPSRVRIRGLIAGLGARLRDLMQRDQQDQTALHSGRAAIKTDLSNLGAGRAARAAYGPAVPSRTRFADQTG